MVLPDKRFVVVAMSGVLMTLPVNGWFSITAIRFIDSVLPSNALESRSAVSIGMLGSILILAVANSASAAKDDLNPVMSIVLSAPTGIKPVMFLKPCTDNAEERFISALPYLLSPTISANPSAYTEARAESDMTVVLAFPPTIVTVTNAESVTARITLFVARTVSVAATESVIARTKPFDTETAIATEAASVIALTTAFLPLVLIAAEADSVLARTIPLRPLVTSATDAASVIAHVIPFFAETTADADAESVTALMTAFLPEAVNEAEAETWAEPVIPAGSSAPKNSPTRMSLHCSTDAPDMRPKKEGGRSCCGCLMTTMRYPWMILPVARTMPVDVVPATCTHMRHDAFGISGIPSDAQSAVNLALAIGL